MHKIKLPPAIVMTFPVASSSLGGGRLNGGAKLWWPDCSRDRVFRRETTSTKLGEEKNSTGTFHTISFPTTRERRRWCVRSLRVLNATPEKGSSIQISGYDQHCQDGGLSEKVDEYKQRLRDCGRYRDRETKGAEQGKKARE